MQLEMVRSLDVNAVRRDFPILKQPVDGKRLIWLDNASTTQKPQCVIDALVKFYQQDNSNVHRAVHTLGTRATVAYEAARDKVKEFLGARLASEIVFVRGTTEAINLVAHTYGQMVLRPGDEIVVSAVEHHSNIVPWQLVAQNTGAILKVAPVSDRGEILLDDYASLLTPRTRIVALAHVSNALGTILPVQEMTQMAHEYGATVLLDGAQGVPHLPVNVQNLGCDFYAFSGHKLFGPMGIGVLYGRQALLEAMVPWQGGGSMIRQVTFEQTTYDDPPARFEAGTPNVADAIGLGVAIDYLNHLGMDTIEHYEQQLTDYAINRLASIPNVQLIGTAHHKVGVLSFVMANHLVQEIGHHLAQQGVAVRAGHHCAQPTMQRYGVTATVRPSLAFYNTYAEVDFLAETLQRYGAK